MIKLDSSRAVITEPFKVQLRYVYRKMLDQIKRNFDTAPSYSRRAIVAGKKPHVARLIHTLSSPVGFDLELTRLRALPYASYDAVEHKGKLYFYCRTKDVIAEMGREKYNLGPYDVAIKVQDALACRINDIHMIPVRDPLIDARHMHHHRYANYDSHYREVPLESPLDARVGTCWGNFPNLVMGTLTDGDMVEFFRIIHIFLTRLNPSSPLESFGRLTFAEVTR